MPDPLRILGLHIAPNDVVQYNGDNWGPHDTAAALVDQDGTILAAVEEERLNRIKHANFFPVESIRYCLESQGLTGRNLDYIAFPVTRLSMMMWTVQRFWVDATRPFQTVEQSLGGRFQELLGIDVSDKFQFSEHHEAHAWSAFGCSEFSRALVLVVDGDGEQGRSGLVAIGEGHTLNVLKRLTVEQSIGRLYQELTHMLGYHRFDEYKIMGLAPYGDPAVLEPLFRKGYHLLEDGHYAIAPLADWMGIFMEGRLLSQARRKGEPFSQFHKDFAAALQATTEKILLHVLGHYQRQTGLKHLCVAGGVGHNCSANGEIYRSGLFDQVFFQPVAHDAGLAIGAALDVLHRVQQRPARRPLSHLYLGPAIGSSDAIGAELTPWRNLASMTRIEAPAERAAALIAEGAVIGWVQGRSEFGPRALGNRSILGDPRPAENKDRINQMVKKREGYRPFAPSVAEEQVGEFFEVTLDRLSLPFMILTLKVKAPYRERLGAITHVDGTARIQTVSRATNPEYWALLQAFSERTGFPIVLNTSMNNHAEPIVDSIDDAMVCYLTTGLTHLIVGDWLIEKRALADRDHEGLYLDLPLHRFLVQKQRRDGSLAFTVGSNVHPWLCSGDHPLSASVHQVLQCADGRTGLGELLSAAGIREPARRSQMVDEIVTLWGERAVILSPRVRR
jgi:carbamoyltransferase